jgi:hypothetical protein
VIPRLPNAKSLENVDDLFKDAIDLVTATMPL